MSKVEEAIILPKSKVKATSKSPRKLVIFSKPKVGKTSALAALDDALILDFERGSDFLDALKIRITSLEQLRKVGEEIIKQNRPYKYIVVDTITKVEDFCIPLANSLYRATAMGVRWGLLPDGKIDPSASVLTLPNGAGYGYLREAFFKILSFIETLGDRIIYLGHLKAKFIEKNGKEVTAAELDLTGKIKSMLSADVDAIGLLYREDNKNILSFETSDDIICGARPDHLKNTKIVLSEYKDGKLVVNWSKVFVD